MTNSIVGQPTSQPTPLRVEASAQPANVADTKAWHSAFEHAMAGDFHGWFQPPGVQHALGTAPRGAAVAAWTVVPVQKPEKASQASTPSMASDAPGHGRATTTRQATRSDIARPARTSDDDAASTAGVPAPVPAVALEKAVGAPDLRIHALLSTLVGLTGLQAVLAPDLASAAEPPLAIAQRAGDAAPQFAAAAAGARMTGEPAAPSSPAPATRLPTGAATDEREPLRVHAQWSDDGVHLWLGADVGGFAAVNAVTAQLQQALAAQGTRLLRVICNGRDISELPARDLADTTRFDAQVDAGSPVAADRVVPLSF